MSEKQTETSTGGQDLGPFKGGRPFKFTDPAELRRLIQNYFDFCDPHIETRVIEGGTNQRGETIWYKREIMTPQKSYTTSGLARALGTSRQTLLEYQQVDHYTDEISEEVRQELIDAIGDAKRRVEEFAESQLFEGNANGAKFNLTNNHGWVEKTVQEHEGGFFGAGGRLEVEIVNPEPRPMSLPNLKLSQTQSLALRLLHDPTVVELLFGGGAGGAKSFIVCIWMVLECRNYAGIRIGLGREELKRLKQTTVVTLLSKVHQLLGVKDFEYTYSEQSGTITYRNGSQILLIDMKYHPMDPEYDTFGSLELTHVVIEEVGEVQEKGVRVLSTRKNRFLNKEYGIVGKTVMTCNPTQNFIKRMFYEVYKSLGMGRYQKWEHGQVELADGRLVTAFRAFVKSLVFDNPFVSRNYIETLNQAPTAERKRLRDGDWDVDEADYMLFPSLVLDRALRANVTSNRRVLGVDIADGGKDSTRVGVMDDGVLSEIIEIPVDSASTVDTAEQTALGIIKVAQQRGINPQDVGIDGVGVGAGVRAILRGKGWQIQVFEGGAAPTEPGYQDLRSEQFWKTGQDLRQSSIGIYVDLQDLPELRDELRPHQYTNDDKIIRVTPKNPGRGAKVGQSIKELLGRSPDRADCFVIARWVNAGSGDPRNDQSRIAL